MTCLLSWVVILINTAAALVTTADTASSLHHPQRFKVLGDQIYFNDTTTQIRGISWFGFETELRVVEGLWANPMTYYLDILQAHQFNVLRIPFSEQLILYEPTAIPAQMNVKGDPVLKNKSCRSILTMLIRECAKRGIAVLLDLHVLKLRVGHPLWYLPKNANYSEAAFMETWEEVLTRFGQYPNLLGIELINEPHDGATFGTGDPSTDVDQLASRFLERFAGPDAPLVFLNGIWWGKDFRGVANNTVIMSSNRVVFAPHFYGPTLAPLPTYSSTYMQWYYKKLLGDIMGTHPIVITEWGFNPGKDMEWVEGFIQTMELYNITNNIFWALNPSGKDIRGLLQPDWNGSVDPARMTIIEKLSPLPTVFRFDLTTMMDDIG